MATNRDLLKEAIADAKAVKDAAIANAKVALEEAFTPYLKEKFAAKLAEIEEEEMEEGMETEGYEKDSMEERLGTINDPSEEGVGNAFSAAPHGNLEEEDDTMEEELDLEALLRELEEGDEEMYEEEMTEAEDKEKMDKAEDEMEDEMGEEEVSLEDMTEDELRELIEDVIAGMVEAGELEAGEGMEGEEGEEEMESEEEVDIEELMAEVKKEKMKSKGREEIEEAKRKTKEAEMKKEKAEKELKEAYDTLAEIQASLQEVKLLNAKLLYTNKIFRAKNLTESQKVKVLESFDKATTVKETKLIYETLNQGLTTKKPVNESVVRGLASKAVGSVENKKPIFEVDSQFARWQVLAGIKTNN